MAEQELTKLEILKVFSKYIPCDCVQEGWFPKEPKYREMIAVDLGSWQCRILLNKRTGENFWFGAHHSYLMLKTLNDVSEEDLIEVAKIAYPDELIHDFLWIPQEGRELVKLIERKTSYTFTHRFANQMYIKDFLREKHYAVPEFFGRDHWATGKTPIELHIAVNVTEFEEKFMKTE